MFIPAESSKKVNTVVRVQIKDSGQKVILLSKIKDFSFQQIGIAQASTDLQELSPLHDDSVIRDHLRTGGIEKPSSLQDDLLRQAVDRQQDQP